MKHVFVIFLISTGIFLSMGATSVRAQTLKMALSDTSQVITIGSNVTVDLLINTNSVPVINADALISFDPARITITSAQVSNPIFFTYAPSPVGRLLGGSTSKYLISGWEQSQAYAKTTTTDTKWASFTFQPISAGTATLTFDCTAGTGADSNINRGSDSADVINCSALTSLAVTVSAATPTPTSTTTVTSTPEPTSSATSPTTTPTPVPTSTPTTAPTTVPPTPKPTKMILKEAGVIENTLGILGLGAVLTIAGLLIIL